MCFRKKSGVESSGPIARRATNPPESPSRISRRLTTPTSPTAIANTEQPRDDASIIRLFSLIDNSITDHVLNYYISSNSGSDKPPQFGKLKKELGWVLRAAASNPALREAQTQVIVIRAIIGAEIFKAIRDNDFIPPAPKKPETKHGTKTPTDHKWRLEYFQSLPKSHLYQSHRQKAIDKLATEITRMTQPLITDKGREETRLKSLKTIVENAADFSVIIGKQKPSFRIIFPQTPTSKSSASAPRSSRAGSRKGRTENLDMPVLVPELRKYGDERGTNYDKYLTLVAAQRLPEGF